MFTSNADMLIKLSMGLQVKQHQQHAGLQHRITGDKIICMEADLLLLMM